MRKLMFVAAIALVGLLPAALPVNAYAQAQTQTPPQSQSDHRLLAVGAGAIVGIVLFNTLTYPLGSVPFVAATLAPTPTNIALGSRVLATLTGGAGGLAAHYLYNAYSN
jgi:peptidoglycan/LPS O-acetylase OafA/YrhL